jgi:hypothetical protein
MKSNPIHMKKIIIALPDRCIYGFEHYGSKQTRNPLQSNCNHFASKEIRCQIIINKIKTTPSNFDLSTDALIKLKEENIPDEILQ